jgi:hypothetical protein
MAQRKFSSTTATPKLANYKKLFAEHLIMERKNGALFPWKSDSP